MKNIVGIHGVARSGTSWLAQLFNSSPDVRLKFQPLFSYAFKNAISDNSSLDEITSFFQAIYESEDDFINMRDTNLLKNYPHFIKNPEQDFLVFKHIRFHQMLPNLLQTHRSLKCIFIIRNPMAVLASWINAPREFKREWNIDEEWKMASKKNKDANDFFGYNKWKEATDIFLKLEEQFAKRVRIIKYSELLQSPEQVISSLFEFVGLPLTQQTISFIKESTSNEFDDPNSVFRIKKNDDSYKNKLPEYIQREIIEDINGTVYEQFLN